MAFVVSLFAEYSSKELRKYPGLTIPEKVNETLRDKNWLKPICIAMALVSLAAVSASFVHSLQALLQSHSHQDSMVLAQRQKYRSME